MKTIKLSDLGGEAAYDLKPRAYLAPSGFQKKNRRSEIKKTNDFESMVLKEFKAQKTVTSRSGSKASLSDQLNDRAIAVLRSFWV